MLLANLSAEVKQVQSHIKNVDACIILFDPDAKLPSLKSDRYAPRHAAPKGHMKRFILSMFREADAPLSSRQIADAWAVEQKVEVNTNTINLLRKRIGVCIQSIKHDGLIEQVGADGLCKLWALKKGDQ